MGNLRFLLLVHQVELVKPSLMNMQLKMRYLVWLLVAKILF